MHIGQLNKRITIQTLATTKDAGGGFTESWTDGETVWASIQPLNGKEQYQSMQLGYEADFKIFVRYRSDLVKLNQKIRIKTVATFLMPWLVIEDPEETLYIDVVDVRNPLFRGKHLEILCKLNKPDR